MAPPTASSSSSAIECRARSTSRLATKISTPVRSPPRRLSRASGWERASTSRPSPPRSNRSSPRASNKPAREPKIRYTVERATPAISATGRGSLAARGPRAVVGSSHRECGAGSLRPTRRGGAGRISWSAWGPPYLFHWTVCLLSDSILSNTTCRTGETLDAKERLDKEVPVLIVGAGPAGLAAAVTLWRAKVSTRCWWNAGRSLSSAAASDDDEHALHGAHALVAAWRTRSRAGEVEVEWLLWRSKTLASALPTARSYRRACRRGSRARWSARRPRACVPQDHLEPVLLNHLRTFSDGPAVELGTEVLAVDSRPDGVEARPARRRHRHDAQRARPLPHRRRRCPQRRPLGPWTYPCTGPTEPAGGDDRPVPRAALGHARPTSATASTASTIPRPRKSSSPPGEGTAGSTA